LDGFQVIAALAATLDAQESLVFSRNATTSRLSQPRRRGPSAIGAGSRPAFTSARIEVLQRRSSLASSLMLSISRSWFCIFQLSKRKAALGKPWTA
jgi:hypothetical protein